MELEQIRELALEAFSNLKDELDVTIDIEILESTNILGLLDSMDVVSLIMETESLVEAKVNHYVALANEKSFSADGSPLLSFSTWVSYISEMMELSDGS
jgi:hypothetical protein